MIPDGAAADYIGVPWGDKENDENLSTIFHYISNGSFSRISTAERMAKNKSLRLPIPSTSHPLRFNGMVDYRISNQLKPVINKSLRRTH
jgi:hypothetical protein